MTAASDRHPPPKGEPPSFAALYAAHRAQVFRWGMRYGGGKIDWAEDLTHDVFVKTFELLPTLRDTEDLGGWLYRVTANLAIERIRREQSIFTRIARLYRAGKEQSAPSAEVRVFAREEAEAAAGALASLPAKERVALCMLVIDGKSQREIARALSLSDGYVSKLIHRAWDKMRAAGWDGGDDARA